MTSPTATLRQLHDRLGSMIDQVGHPDYSLRELVDGLREVRDALLSQSADGDTVPRADYEAALLAACHWGDTLDEEKGSVDERQVLLMGRDLRKRLSQSATPAISADLQEVLDYYDQIVARAPVGDTEWDFVMTAAEYRKIREALE